MEKINVNMMVPCRKKKNVIPLMCAVHLCLDKQREKWVFMQDLCQTHSIKLRQEACYNSIQPNTPSKSVSEEVRLKSMC